ncbi:MAG: histidinol dehydrogenase [bacterium]
MRTFRFGTPESNEAVRALCSRFESPDLASLETAVREILRRVQTRGDDALLEYTAQWDGVRLGRSELEVPPESLDRALDTLDPDSRDCLQFAAERIRRFHEHQKQTSWEVVDETGSLMGQRISPLDRVGVYVPGGRAAYPSSLLMNVLPAKVAGVASIFVVTPPGGERAHPAVLAAARLAGVDRVFRVGGAQAIGALAFGTATIPAVDKIVGPGNLYVATAKRLVFGKVDIDMVAGPSEVLIVTDGHADPVHLAADLLAQAEHDPQALPLLVSTSSGFLADVLAELERQKSLGPWEQTASAAVRNNGRAFLVRDLDEALELVNTIAPEHLELAVRDPVSLSAGVRHAGAIFLGCESPETLGDYVAGPNHVLPTMGTARFSSPLGVYDFVKRTSVIRMSPQGLSELGPWAARLARMEGLHAHAHAVEVRMRRQSVET